jgi:hypothetical protein
MSDKRRREDDVFGVICEFAEAFPGSTPSRQFIADLLGLSPQRISYLMNKLEEQGRIKMTSIKSYYVPGSIFTAPDSEPPLRREAPQDEVFQGGGHSRNAEREKLTSRVRFEILQRDDFTCRACGRNPRKHNVSLHVDHIVPISRGGKTEPKNLQTLCAECNLSKGTKEVKQMQRWQ